MKNAMAVASLLAWMLTASATLGDLQVSDLKCECRVDPLGVDVTWVKAHHESPYGRIVSNWRREAGKLQLEVTIPPNTTATVFVPTTSRGTVTGSGGPAAEAAGVTRCDNLDGCAVFTVGSGRYLFATPIAP